MTILSKVTVGSRLYGTDVPGSDLDYRGVYLPSARDCHLGRIRDTWDDPSEQDTQYFSLQTFLRLASEGQSMAIEMLAAPPQCVMVTSPIWEDLRANRRLFYTKSMYSFLGYAKSMAGKYSARIDRLIETEAILKTFAPFMGMSDEGRRLNTLWDQLPESLNAVKTVNDRSSGPDKRVYQVCGREIQASVTVSHAYTVIKAIHDGYGARVRAAKQGQIDWKALMHAFRVAYQAKEIVTTGDLAFPLANANWLKDLRMGRIDFFAEHLDQRLDDLIAEVQTLMDASALPDKVDKDWVDQFVIGAYAP